MMYTGSFIVGSSWTQDGIYMVIITQGTNELPPQKLR